MGMGSPALPRSDARNTPTIPGARRAAEASIERMRAWACGERSIAACRQPGTRKSSTNSPMPVMSRGSSRRRTVPACSAIYVLLAFALGGQTGGPVESARDERAKGEYDEDDSHDEQEDRDRPRDEDEVAPGRHGQGLAEGELHHGGQDQTEHDGRRLEVELAQHI